VKLLRWVKDDRQEGGGSLSCCEHQSPAHIRCNVLHSFLMFGIGSQCPWYEPHRRTTICAKASCRPMTVDPYHDTRSRIRTSARYTVSIHNAWCKQVSRWKDGRSDNPTLRSQRRKTTPHVIWIALDRSTFSVRLCESGLTLRGLEKSRRQKIQ